MSVNHIILRECYSREYLERLLNMLCMTTNHDFNIILLGDKQKPVHRVLKCVTNVYTDVDNVTFFFLLGYSEPEDTFVLNDEFVSVDKSISDDG